MTILIKNKYTLQIDEFKFRCCMGKKGSTKNKKEGDKKTPKGIFKIENLYFRKDRKDKPSTLLKCIAIKKIWDGAMTFVFQKNIINSSKFKKKSNMKNCEEKIISTIF